MSSYIFPLLRTDAGQVTYNMACSRDGKYIVFGFYSNRLYTSSDYGATWTERQPAGDVNRYWEFISMSGDGRTIIAEEYGFGISYISTDYGVTWVVLNPFPGGDLYASSSINNDGSVIFMVSGNGRCMLTKNSGVSWVEVRPIDDNDYKWYSPVTNEDGTKLIVLEDILQNTILYSSDSGASWSNISPRVLIGNEYWSVRVKATPDLSVMYCHIRLSGGTMPTEVYRSTNYGTSWTNISAGLWATQNRGAGIVTSSNGETVFAFDTFFSPLYLSENYGATWEEIAPPVPGEGEWTGLALDATGNRLVIAGYYDKIYSYISNHLLTYTAGAGGSISGTTPQTVIEGEDGDPVTAKPDSGYLFSSWSDGVLTATRTDTNVVADLNVTANFEKYTNLWNIGV